MIVGWIEDRNGEIVCDDSGRLVSHKTGVDPGGDLTIRYASMRKASWVREWTVGGSLEVGAPCAEHNS